MGELVRRSFSTAGAGAVKADSEIDSWILMRGAFIRVLRRIEVSLISRDVEVIPALRASRA